MSPGPVGFSPLEQMWFSVRTAGQETTQNSHTAKRFLGTLLTAHFLLEFGTCRAKPYLWHRIYSFGKRKGSNSDHATVI